MFIPFINKMLVVDTTLPYSEEIEEMVGGFIPYYVIKEDGSYIKIDEKAWKKQDELIFSLLDDIKSIKLKTSAPSEGDILDVLQKRNGGKIITVASGLSSIHQKVKKVVEEYGLNYEVVDSKQVDVGYRLFVLKGGKCDVETMVLLHNSSRKHLEKSGRVSGKVLSVILGISKLNFGLRFYQNQTSLGSMFFEDLESRFKKIAKDWEVVGKSIELRKEREALSSLALHVHLGTRFIALSRCK